MSDTADAGSADRSTLAVAEWAVSDTGHGGRRRRGLEVADEAAGGPLARLLARLTQARNALRAAATDIDRFREETTVRNLLDECAEAVAALRTPT